MRSQLTSKMPRILLWLTKSPWTKEQKFELSAYMERTKSEYLQKIIE